MKKIREGKQNKRNGSNFFKYLQPQPSNLLHQSKLHSRSLIELQPNTSRYQQSARMPSGRDAHHSSLCSNDTLQVDTIKSSSLKKFFTIFGGPANLNQNLCAKNSARVDQKAAHKASSRQIFTCNIKNVNVNVSSSKDRESKQGNSVFVIKKEKPENSRPAVSSIVKYKQEQAIISQLTSQLEQAKQRENMLKKQIEQYQRENQLLKSQKESMIAQNKMVEGLFCEKEKELNRKIEQLQKNVANKDKCREHDLVIESLKKVINEQLRKIIELQKSKIERQEIERLEERINKNITVANEATLKERLKMIEGSNINVGIKRKETKIIKIEEQCLQSAATSPNRELQTYEDIIQEATEQEQRGSQSKVHSVDEDSILQQVDKYLAKWRLKS